MATLVTGQPDGHTRDRGRFAAMLEPGYRPPPVDQELARLVVVRPVKDEKGRPIRLSREEAEAAAEMARTRSIAQAARFFGVHRGTLYRYWARYGIRL
jgi:DNA invertase Pin-like site-specific DNA recombinase